MAENWALIIMASNIRQNSSSLIRNIKVRICNIQVHIRNSSSYSQHSCQISAKNQVRIRNIKVRIHNIKVRQFAFAILKFAFATCFHRCSRSYSQHSSLLLVRITITSYPLAIWQKYKRGGWSPSCHARRSVWTVYEFIPLIHRIITRATCGSTSLGLPIVIITCVLLYPVSQKCVSYNSPQDFLL